MNSDNIILRIVTVAGLTTKGSQLTPEELDENFIAIWQDLKQRLSAGALAAYDSLTAYLVGDAVSYDNKTWIALDASTGTTPGSDEDIWSEIPVEYLAHQKDKDEALAKGTADEVTAAEIRAFIDGGGAGANFFNTNITADADRAHDADGFGVSVANLSHWWSDSSDFAPSLGRASHEWWGYGSGASDVLTRVRNGAGSLVFETLGDTNTKFYGDIHMNALKGIVFNDNAGLNIRQSSSANAIQIGTNNGSFWNFGWDSSEGGIRAVGALGSTAIALVSSSANTVIRHAASGEALYWESGKVADDYKIRGTVSSTLKDIITVSQVTGKTLFEIGHIHLKPLTTTEINALTSVEGDIAYNVTLGQLCVKSASGWQKLSQSTM